MAVATAALRQGRAVISKSSSAAGSSLIAYKKISVRKLSRTKRVLPVRKRSRARQVRQVNALLQVESRFSAVKERVGKTNPEARAELGAFPAPTLQIHRPLVFGNI